MKCKFDNIIIYKAIAVMGLSMAVLLQTIWTCNTYKLLERDLENKINRIFYSSLNDEISNRFSNYQADEIIKIAEVEPNEMTDKNGVNIMLMDFMENRLHHPLSLSILDSIYSVTLERGGISCRYKLKKVNLKTQQVLASVRPELHSWSEIETTAVPIRKDGTAAVQAVVISPYKLIFERMVLLLVGTILIFALAAYCITYQIKIIIRQRKIAKLREDFSYAMIHDMKTPISTILIGTKMLHSGKLEMEPLEKEKHFRVIEKQTESLLQFANRMLTISKLENDRIDFQKNVVSLEPLFNDIIESFKMKAEKPVDFRLELKAMEVYADSEFLKEALENMIDNAIKYSKPDGVKILISSSDDEVVSCTAIHIRDNGLGISTADQKKIFEKFERASAIRRTPKGGAVGFGLGLNYVFQVMKAHGGMVEVRSVKGKYSDFELLFPKYFDLDKVEA